MISVSRTGTTRFVLVVGRWAMKFARSARGRRCNRYEANLFASVDERRRSMLCPVRWHTQLAHCNDGRNPANGDRKG
jgi:hypothetical protein